MKEKWAGLIGRVLRQKDDTIWKGVSFLRMNDGVRKDQREVEGANHLLKKEKIRLTSSSEREDSLC